MTVLGKWLGRDRPPVEESQQTLHRDPVLLGGVLRDHAEKEGLTSLAGYSMFAVGIGTLFFGYWRMMKWNRERR